MADYRRTKFERRMKAYRDHLKNKILDSKEEVGEKKQMTEEDKKKFIEMWQNMTKKQ